MSTPRPRARHTKLLCLPTLIGLCTLAALPSHSQATFDDFNHFPGVPLSGQNGGTGWASPWSGSGATVTDRKLSDPTGALPARCTSVGVRAGSGEFLSVSRTTASAYGRPGTTEWFSFTIVRTGSNPGAADPPAYGGVAVGGSPSLFIGDMGSGHWGMDTSGPPALKDVVDAGPIADNIPTFLVVRADFRAGATRLTLYQNPRPGRAAPDVQGVVKTDLTLTPARSVTITYGNGSAYTLGALRLGRSYAAVAPAASTPHRPGHGG